MYKSFIINEIKDEEKDANILAHLFGDTKSNYIANVIDGWSLDRCWRNSSDVFEWLVKELANKVEPDDMIRSTIDARLNFSDL